MTKVDTVIVGAGPYGLSLAAHFRSANIDVRIIGQPMESWRKHMPIGMMLKSEAFASNLSDPDKRYSLQNFSAASGAAYQPKGIPVRLSDFIAYGDWFRRLAVPEIHDAKVSRVRPTLNGFELVLSDGEVVATRRLIVATGYMAFQRIPLELSGLTNVSHSSAHRDLSTFAGQDVTIVGCGQSGLETAALLREAGAAVRVLARSVTVDWNQDPPDHQSWADRLRYPEAALGPGLRSRFYSEHPRIFSYLPVRNRERAVATTYSPAGAWWLKARVLGKIPILAGHAIADAVERNGKIELRVKSPDGDCQFSTDHVIAATGYAVDLNRLTFLDSELRSKIKAINGSPLLNSDFESTVPGLHFVGVTSALSFGPVMRFVYGAKHAASALTAHVMAARPRCRRTGSEFETPRSLQGAEGAKPRGSSWSWPKRQQSVKLAPKRDPQTVSPQDL